MFDRHLVVLPDPGQAGLAPEPGPRVMLTAVNPPAGQILAQSGQPGGRLPVLKELLGWYSRHIANRRAGDKLEVGDEYFLRPPAN
jgi:hypothetical protein